MPITVQESISSREYTPARAATLVYVLRGTVDEAAAVAALEATAPTDFHGLRRQPVTVEPVWVDEGNPDAGLWTGTVRYAQRASATVPQTGDAVFSFDTGGGTQHLTQSLATVSRHGAPGTTAPDFQGAIGVSQDRVEGVDITVPVYSFAETHYLPDAQVTSAYKQTLCGLTGKVNAGGFRGFAAGEVLFLGASGAKRGAEDWEISFRFAASKNATGLTVGAIGPISKKGWEYLWVRYEDAADDAAQALVKRPVAAYVEKVYEDASFGGLGIGS